MLLGEVYRPKAGDAQDKPVYLTSPEKYGHTLRLLGSYEGVPSG